LVAASTRTVFMFSGAPPKARFYIGMSEDPKKRKEQNNKSGRGWLQTYWRFGRVFVVPSIRTGSPHVSILRKAAIHHLPIISWASKLDG